MSAFDTVVLLKSIVPQAPALSFLAAPKSSSMSRRPPPGCPLAKSQPRAYAYEARAAGDEP
jgi:hypothetical protein